MLHRIQRALSRTLARQMVFALTLFLSITLSLFSWEMMRRQQVRQARQQQEQVLALAASLAVSSGVWVSARDYSGLQEIVQGVAQFPEMRYAMVLDTQGLILAHLPAQRRGQYITDVPVAVAPRVLHMADHVTDITQPIRLGTSHVGWVRVGVGNGSFEAEFATDRRDVVLFTLLAIVLGTAVASLIARHQTRRLRHVERVARAVQQGQSQLRARVSGIDEAAQLAEHFNAMLDRIDDRERALRDSESLLRHSQELGKIGSWEWDVEKSSMQWTPETFRIHELPVQAELPQGQAAIDLSVACYAPLDRERVLKAFARCIQEGVPFDLECRFITTRQRPLWIRTQGQAEVRDGKVVKVVGYIADITERKKMEEDAAHRAVDAYNTELIKKAVANATVEIPEIMVADRVEQMVQELAMNMESRGLKLDDYLKFSNKTLEQLKEEYKETAAENVRTDLVLDAVAKAENIQVTSEDMNMEIFTMAQNFGADPKEVYKIILKEHRVPKIGRAHV